jgi:hypothetical protein
MELGGFEPPTSWVRSRLADQPETAYLQAFSGHFSTREWCWIAVDYSRLPAIEPLVGHEWLKRDGGEAAADFDSLTAANKSEHGTSG